MLPFGITAVEFAVVTFMSALVGILLIIGGSRFVRVRYLAAFALGVYLWYFADTLGGANYLDVNGGFTYSGYLVSLVLLFVVGLVAFFAVDRSAFADGKTGGYGALAIGALAALALGLHGMAEGADFGFTAAQTASSSLLGAFGGLAEGASWVLHKMLEPTIAAVSYVALAGPGSRKYSDRFLDAVVIATVFTVPAVAGSVAGYYIPFDITYVYALGLGTSVYALTRAWKAAYSPEASGSWPGVTMALSAGLGFVLIFIAALLHS